MNPHSRVLLFSPSFIAKSSKGTSLLISCQIVTSAASGHLLGRCPKAKLHFLISHLGAGFRWLYSHFYAMAFSHMQHMLAT